MERPKYRSPQGVEIENRIWPTRRIRSAPVWVSVDLRDGNQAFVRPMNVENKIRYFRRLVETGFKEIEVAYPAASRDEFDFVRRLIEEERIPDDVCISVFTAARPDLVERTIEAIRGVKQAIVHCYLATSDLHGRFVFGKSREELKNLAVAGTRMIAEKVAAAGLENIRYEFSPEEFTDSDPVFIVDLATAVKKAWGSCRRGGFIMNLPATVERRPPNEYADLIEFFTRHYPYLDETVLSVHAHNDQGCAIAATEMAVLAGAERVEGTLFGHGERTGNLDIMAFALNLHSRGIATGLDFTRLPEIAALVEEVSGIAVHPRHPYAGELVFTAFSGTHQDAIGKGMARRAEISEHFDVDWKMPYLHIDPADVGRDYDKLIRINSQSGKGGVAFMLESCFGISLPPAMRIELGRQVQRYAEQTGREITPGEIYTIFREKVVDTPKRLNFSGYSVRNIAPNSPRVEGVLTVDFDGRRLELAGHGNGPVAAAAAALRQLPGVPDFELTDYWEKALNRGEEAAAIALVTLTAGAREPVCGAGIDGNIDLAAVKAMVNALAGLLPAARPAAVGSA